MQFAVMPICGGSIIGFDRRRFLKTGTTTSILTMPNLVNSNTVIVFSESLGERDRLRNLITELGFNTVSFEREAICFDNFRPLSPKIVIVQTDSDQIVWRFVFAIYAMNLGCPLVIVSDVLNKRAFDADGTGPPVFFTPLHRQGEQLRPFLSKISSEAQDDGSKGHLPLFVGQTDAIKEIRSKLPSIAVSRDPVLIRGEKGTGKELLVRLITNMAKVETPLIKIDCGELYPEMLINGWLEEIINANTESKPVTIFLDGIHKLPQKLQPEMLLIMEGPDAWKSQQNDAGSRDIRFIVACNPIIEDLVNNGKFRKDLYYRLNVIPIHIPPLRERKDDIALLMDYFILNAGAGSRKSIMIPSQKARDSLYLYNWPGNVEELKTYMWRVFTTGNESCIFSNSNIPKVRKNMPEYFMKFASVEDLPKFHEIKSYFPDLNNMSLKTICDEFVFRTEKKTMQKALEFTNWNRKKAAELLNISYKSMLNKMKAYDII